MASGKVRSGVAPQGSWHPCQGKCGVLVRPAGRCNACKRKRWKSQDQWRGNAAQRLYDHRWQEQSTLYLKANPTCVRCSGTATVVDHKAPHRGDTTLFWDTTNWQSLCKPCHDTKTAVEDGAFGRPLAPRDAVGSGPSPLDNLFADVTSSEPHE